MIELLLIVLGSLLATCFWFLLCNERTYKQRSEILCSIQPGSGDFWDQMEVFTAVSYKQHLWALAMFSDPYALYKTPYHVVAMREDAE